MKKGLAVVWIILPFVFCILWIVFSLILSNWLDTTNSQITIWYLKIFSTIITLIGLITLVIWTVYIWKEKWFTHKEIISKSWKLTKRNIWKFAFWILLLFIFQIIQQWLSDPNLPITVVTVVLSILFGILYLRVDFWLKWMSLRLTEDKKVRAFDVFIDPERFFKYFVAYIIIWVFTVVWTILLIVPWIIIALRLNMVPYLIIEKKLGPRKAIKQSRSMTKWKISNLFALNILLWGINILWILALIVWLFWALPIFYIANAVFYQKLLAHHKK